MGKVEEYALQFLKAGRKDWDEPHTRTVVYYATKIGEANGLDTKVLATAAWFHDIGYFGLFENDSSDDYDKIQERKRQHMINGARMAKEFLERDDVKNEFTKEQKVRVIHLVGVHDKLDQLMDLDEKILMEADSLGAIDIKRVKPSFSKEQMQKYLAGSYKKRFSGFETKMGKEIYLKLINKYRELAES